MFLDPIRNPSTVRVRQVNQLPVRVKCPPPPALTQTVRIQRIGQKNRYFLIVRQTVPVSVPIPGICSKLTLVIIPKPISIRVHHSSGWEKIVIKITDPVPVGVPKSAIAGGSVQLKSICQPVPIRIDNLGIRHRHPSFLPVRNPISIRIA